MLSKVRVGDILLGDTTDVPVLLGWLYRGLRHLNGVSSNLIPGVLRRSMLFDVNDKTGRGLRCLNVSQGFFFILFPFRVGASTSA